MRFRILMTSLLMLCGALNAAAQTPLVIRITEGVEKPLPVAVVPFLWTGEAGKQPLDMHVTIGNDLTRSGRFRPMEEQDLPQRPTRFEDVNFKDWRLLGMEHVVIGQLRLTGEGQYEVEFRLVDIYNGRQIAGFRIPAAHNQVRRTAHRIADIVFEKLTGIRGAFDTRVAYVTVRKTAEGKQHTLQVADADGFNSQVLLESAEPLMSPAWSPDGRRLAYVSFEGRNSTVFVQDIYTGAREKVASNPGINSAPAWSPDGTRLALTLSRDGNAEVYVLHMAGRKLQRITSDPSIDTEPNWSPDGTRLAFTSDRGGGPQIYEISANGGTPKRLTFSGNYNARPRFAPDGKSIALVNGAERLYRIGLLDLQSGEQTLLTRARLDESPSFAPNGSMIIYTTTLARGNELAAVSVDGRVHQRLALQDGEVREPAWGPFLSAP